MCIFSFHLALLPLNSYLFIYVKVGFYISFHYSILSDICYLDHVGAGLYADSQIDAITEYLKNNLLGNPHSLNLSSKYCHDAVDQIRFQYVFLHFVPTNELCFSSVTFPAPPAVVFRKS